MPTINLGRIKPVWRGYWSAGTAYVKDDMVRFDVDSYICTSAHTSGSSFSTGAGWELMMEGSAIPSQAGNTGKVLVTDGANSYWGAVNADLFPAGSIVQAVPVRWTSRFTGSGTYTDSGLDINITPKFANSKILLVINMQISTSSTTVGYNVYRNDSQIQGVLSATGGNSGYILSSSGGPSSSSWNVAVGFVGYDEPNTTSNVKYSIYMGSHDGRTWYVNTTGSNNQHDGAGRISGAVAYEIKQ